MLEEYSTEEGYFIAVNEALKEMNNNILKLTESLNNDNVQDMYENVRLLLGFDGMDINIPDNPDLELEAIKEEIEVGVEGFLKDSGMYIYKKIKQFLKWVLKQLKRLLNFLLGEDERITHIKKDIIHKRDNVTTDGMSQDKINDIVYSDIKSMNDSINLDEILFDTDLASYGKVLDSLTTYALSPKFFVTMLDRKIVNESILITKGLEGRFYHDLMSSNIKKYDGIIMPDAMGITVDFKDMPEIYIKYVERGFGSYRDVAEANKNLKNIIKGYTKFAENIIKTLEDLIDNTRSYNKTEAYVFSMRYANIVISNINKSLTKANDNIKKEEERLKEILKEL